MMGKICGYAILYASLPFTNMTSSLISPSSSRQPCSGFALVIALSLMAFVLLLLLSITTLVQVEAQSSQIQMHQMEAEQSALLGLQIALGELQKTAGPDQRVTATAGLVNGATPVESTQHYTGVWNSDPSIPAGNRFMQWLVSSSNNQPAQGVHTEAWSNTVQPVDSGTAYSVSAGNEEDFVLLVGNGAVDAASALSIQAVVAEKIAYSNSNASAGKYAWWVGDEGVKAKANVGTNEDNLNFASTDLNDQLSTAYNLSASPRSGVEVLAPEYANFSNVLTDAAYRNDVAKINSFAGIQILEAGALSGTNVLKGNYHDLTLDSYGLLTNPVTGGLKEDLSLAFEYGIKDINTLTGTDEYLYTESYTHPNASAITVRGPRWDILQEYYLNYKSLDFSGDIPSAFIRKGELAGELSSSQADEYHANIDYYSDPVVLNVSTTIDGLDSGSIPRATSAPLAPVILKSMYYLGMNLGSTSVGMSHDRELFPLQLMGNPVAVLWNPYNITLRVDPSGPDFAAIFTNNFDVGFQVLHRRVNGAGFRGTQTFPYGREENKSTRYMTNGTLTASAAPNIWGTHFWDTELLAEIYRQNTTPTNFDNDHGFQSALTLASSFSIAPGEIVVISSAVAALSGGSPDNANRIMPAQTGFPIASNGWILENLGRSVTFDPATGFEEWDIDSDGNYIYDTFIGTINTLEVNCHSGEYQSAGFGAISSANEVEYTSLRVSNVGMEPIFDPSSLTDQRGSNSNYRLGEAQRDLRSGAYPSLMRNLTSNYPTSLVLYESGVMAAEDRDDTNTNDVELYYDPGRITPVIDRPLEMFLFNSPRAPISGPSHSSFVGQNRMPNELIKFHELQPNVPFPDGVQEHWGEYADTSGYSRLVTWDVPRVPLTSIAQLQHAPIERFAYEPSYAIGNSYASPYVGQNELISTQSDTNLTFDRQVYGSSVDSSYFSNEALWDNYFFSSIAPELQADGSFNTIDEVIADFTASTSGSVLANSRIHLYQPDGETVVDLNDTLNDTLNASMLSAKYLMVDGAFNINSVSVAAWKAFLSGLNQIPVSTGQLSSESLTAESNSGIVFSRFSTPVRSDESNEGENDDWEGYRILTEIQIGTLATEIVDQIKSRGTPFLSLAEFVNRDLSDTSGTDWRAGILQRAIDAAGLNSSLANSGSPTNKAGGINGLQLANPQAGPDLTGGGAAGYLLQGDILNSVGPFMSNRSNTFKIRAYGESLGLTGQVVSSAYVEAVVQQVADYCDPLNSPEDIDGVLTPVSRVFGRKFKIVSIRWINEQDV